MSKQQVTNSLKSTTEDLQTIWEQVQEKYPEANFLQSPEWQKTNQALGHKVIIEHFAEVAWCLTIVKNAKRGRYLEIPGGPLLDWSDRSIVERMFARIRQIAKQEKCVFVRLRPQVPAQNIDQLAGLGLRKSPMHLHAEHTVMLDLSQSEEELLAKMRRQTRYEVRRAEKLGLKVEFSNDKKIFQEFHAVQEETARRQNFVPPDLATLLAEKTGFGDNIRIYKVTVGDVTAEKAKNPELKFGEAIAYGLILWSGDEAEYFEAASTSLGRKLPGAYALQWQVIRDLKKQSIKRYNLWGIAPNGQKNHRYSGVTTFKTGFGGKIVEFVPAQDIIIRPIRYAVDWVIETLRKKKRHL